MVPNATAVELGLLPGGRWRRGERTQGEHLVREECSSFATGLQDRIAQKLEEIDGGRFREDPWERPGGGGGRTRVLHDGAVFEKAGVNFSEVYGELAPELATVLPGDGNRFYATGVSVVVHPRNPRVPAAHMNLRAIARGSREWLGGGADLTPFVLYEEDVRHFHRTLKSACDRHDEDYYPRFKKWCDEYFFLKHRGEARGVGGVFFDDLELNARTVSFWRDVGEAFLDAYVPIVESRREEAFSERDRLHQLRRRGRYVEFNLLYDRGTAFGLRSGGRIQSILMSLPPLVRWDYDARPEPGSSEATLLGVLERPRDWATEEP